MIVMQQWKNLHCIFYFFPLFPNREMAITSMQNALKIKKKPFLPVYINCCIETKNICLHTLEVAFCVM